MAKRIKKGKKSQVTPAAGVASLAEHRAPEPSKRAPRRGRGRGGSGKLIGLIALLLVFIVAMFVTFDYEATQARYGQVYSQIAAEQGLLSQQLTTASIEAATGRADAYPQLKRFRDAFERNLRELERGSASSGVKPLPVALQAELSTLKRSWAEYREQLDTILEGQEAIETVSGYVELINEAAPVLLALSDDVTSQLVKAGAPQQEIYTSTLQLMLIQRIQNNLNRILAGGADIVSAADQFGRDTARFEQNLEAMLDGSRSLGLARVEDAAARAKLAEVARLFDVVKLNVGLILEAAPQLFAVSDASERIQTLAHQLLGAAQQLTASIGLYDQRLRDVGLLGYAFGLAALLVLILLGVLVVRDTRRRLAEQQRQNDENQRAILQLLDEMANLADGDLSVHTTVNEEITGAIADSVNYSIDALRELVATINNTVVQVSRAVEQSRSTTERLLAATNQQGREITSATSAINQMSQSMKSVSADAKSSSDEALRSVEIAHTGAETVRRTIAGMETIREQIQETSKRIKRLGESSQEIGDIVSLITEISDQTNILALNAAIQASMAGEAGRGFAVVADEVQRLAERTGDATKRIESLVSTIQADTNEAVSSMEQSTSNVVKGARLAEDAGTALQEIERSSQGLADRIRDIARSTRSHAERAVDISKSMNVIQEITLQTTEGTNETATSIGNLTMLAEALRESVAGFKLPGEQQAEIDAVLHSMTVPVRDGEPQVQPAPRRATG